MLIKSILLVSLFFLCSNAFTQRKDCTKELRTLICNETYSLGYDTIALKDVFDSLVKVYKIKRIYLVENETGSNHCIFGVMFINRSSAGSFMSKFVKESPHARQFARRPFYYGKAALCSFGRTFLRMLFQKKRYRAKAVELVEEYGCSKFKAYAWASYAPEYRNPQSFEYEAHEILEKDIWNVFLKCCATLPTVYAGTQ